MKLMPLRKSEAVHRDTEVQEIVEKAYKACKQTLSSNWGLVKKLVDLLLVEETVNAETLLTLQSL